MLFELHALRSQHLLFDWLDSNQLSDNPKCMGVVCAYDHQYSLAHTLYRMRARLLGLTDGV
jgi:hypothetical protein